MMSIGGAILKTILQVLMQRNFTVTMITFLKDLWIKKIHNGVIILEY